VLKVKLQVLRSPMPGASITSISGRLANPVKASMAIGALLRRLSMPDMLTAYNRPRVRARRAETFSVETLALHKLVHKRRHRPRRRRNAKQRIALAITPRVIRSGGPS